MSVSDHGSSRYRPHPDQFNWELRAFFCYFMVREEAFDKAVGHLKPLWEDAVAATDSLDSKITYRQLPASDDPVSAINVYIAALRSAVSDQLRCRMSGAPADWVCFALHGSVNGGSLDTGVAPQHFLWMGTFYVPVLSAGAAFVVAKINDHHLFTEEEVERDHTIDATHPGVPFDQWKKLKKLAHEDLDQLLATLRNQVESETSGWPSMNAGGRKTRQQVTMEKLVRWVIGKEEQFAGERSATFELLKELGLDSPGRFKKTE